MGDRVAHDLVAVQVSGGDVHFANEVAGLFVRTCWTSSFRPSRRATNTWAWCFSRTVVGRSRRTRSLRRRGAVSFSIVRLLAFGRAPGPSTVLTLVQTVLIPVATYGLALWRPTKRDFARLHSVLIVMPLSPDCSWASAGHCDRESFGEAQFAVAAIAPPVPAAGVRGPPVIPRLRLTPAAAEAALSRQPWRRQA